MFVRLLRANASLIVLVLLCSYYSVVTWSERFPDDPPAGRKLAQQIVVAHGPEARVLIVVRRTERDTAFARAVQQRMEQGGGTALVTQVGAPSEARQAIVDAAAQLESIDVIATNETAARWGPLQPQRLADLAREYPALAGVQLVKPESYYWPSFLTRENLLNVINQNADIAILAIGMTMVIIAAGIDLSVGSVLALAGVTAAVSIQGLAGGAEASPLGVLGCCMLAVVVATGVGLFNGVMSTVARIPAFIVTLAMMMIARGLALIVAVRYQGMLAGGLTEGTPEAVRILATGFDWLGNGTWLGIPNPIWLMALLYVVAQLVMTRTALGRYIYAVGGNAEAARLSGVPVKTVLILVYALCGAMAGLAGIVDASRFEGGRPNAGEMYELRVIAAVVVGGTSLSGGEGRILGTLIGTTIIAVIQNGLNMSGVKTYEQMVVFGGLILAAALLDRWKR